MPKKKWTPERAKAESKTKVLEALAQKSPLRWNELLKKTQLSPRTLSLALDRMENEGLVYRNMDTGSGYPPPVYYGLTPEGRIHVRPSMFALALFIDIFRTITVPKQIQSDTELEVALKSLAEKVGAIYLFAILKSLQYHDLAWLDRLHDNQIDLNLFDRDIACRLTEPRILEHGNEEDAKTLQELYDRYSGARGGEETPRYYPPLEKQDIRKLQLLLKKSYPDIIGKIDGWFSEFEEIPE